ncbi:MAG TPA: type I-U CRISPR-associated protein Cas5/Cas6 [Phycisphaerales bacterium]|nr:type I-U CRISPR-associated protein Cas5/Cas6 [Phycisphaerales bacterium]
MSFTIRIHLLTGRYSATSHRKRDEGEWPPHPDRFFQALTSAYYHPVGNQPDPGERELLLFLEGLDPPDVICSSASQRSVLTHFVPVNDAKPPNLKEKDNLKKRIERVKEGLSLLPETRLKQPRFFPTVIPEIPDVYFQWKKDLTDEQREALDALLSRVVRVGHSSSLTLCSLVERVEWPDQLAKFHFIPSEKACDISLRVPHAGRLESLDSSFDRGLRPSFVSGTPYALQEEEEGNDTIQSGPYEPTMIVLKALKNQNPVPLTQTLTWTNALRGAILKLGGNDLPSSITGHDQRNKKMEDEHMALVPLANVGHSYADGSLLGLGVVLPSGSEAAQRLKELGLEPLSLNYSWKLERLLDFQEKPPVNLRPWTYAGPRKGSTEWATITPMVLDHHLKTKIRRGASAEERDQAVRERLSEVSRSITRSLQSLGLPKAEVEVSQAPFIAGCAHVRQFPFYRRGRMCRYHTHVRLLFPEPVRGPILLGSGRFRGYGLFRPLISTKDITEPTHERTIPDVAQP